MDLDRQAIERRDFPIGRRGYDTVAVDAHLRALAAEFEELERQVLGGGADISIASTAGSQVQSIIEAAEAAAAEIERQALENANRVREDADRDAERTREEAIMRARGHVAAVAQVAATLLERVASMDGEVSTLMESLRAGAGRLAGDLGAVEASMAELYDAASGRSAELAAEPVPPQASFQAEFEDALAGAPEPIASPPPAEPQPLAEEPAPAAASGDVDGARLIALNMALNGESREDTDRYLAENFQLGDRVKLVDEVYAAVEG